MLAQHGETEILEIQVGSPLSGGETCERRAGVIRSGSDFRESPGHTCKNEREAYPTSGETVLVR